MYFFVHFWCGRYIFSGFPGHQSLGFLFAKFGWPRYRALLFRCGTSALSCSIFFASLCPLRSRFFVCFPFLVLRLLLGPGFCCLSYLSVDAFFSSPFRFPNCAGLRTFGLFLVWPGFWFLSAVVILLVICSLLSVRHFFGLVFLGLSLLAFWIPRWLFLCFPVVSPFFGVLLRCFFSIRALRGMLHSLDFVRLVRLSCLLPVSPIAFWVGLFVLFWAVSFLYLVLTTGGWLVVLGFCNVFFFCPFSAFLFYFLLIGFCFVVSDFVSSSVSGTGGYASASLPLFRHSVLAHSLLLVCLWSCLPIATYLWMGVFLFPLCTGVFAGLFSAVFHPAPKPAALPYYCSVRDGLLFGFLIFLVFLVCSIFSRRPLFASSVVGVRLLSVVLWFGFLSWCSALRAYVLVSGCFLGFSRYGDTADFLITGDLRLPVGSCYAQPRLLMTYCGVLSGYMGSWSPRLGLARR